MVISLIMGLISVVVPANPALFLIWTVISPNTVILHSFVVPLMSSSHGVKGDLDILQPTDTLESAVVIILAQHQQMRIVVNCFYSWCGSVTVGHVPNVPTVPTVPAHLSRHVDHHFTVEYLGRRLAHARHQAFVHKQAASCFRYRTFRNCANICANLCSLQELVGRTDFLSPPPRLLASGPCALDDCATSLP